MSNRGGVHVFRPRFTKPDPSDPTKRVLKTSPNFAFRFDVRGRAYQKAGFRTAALARAAGETRKAEVSAGLEDDWRKLTVLGLYQLAQARQIENDDSTQASFEAVWKRLRKKLPDQALVVDVDDTRLLQLVAEWKAEGAARNTIRLNLQHLRTAMNLAHKKRRLPWVPEFPRLKYERREQALHGVQLAQITAHMPEHYRLFFEAAEESGWRARSELATRKLEHVDFGPERWLCQRRRDIPGCEPPLQVTGDECPACGVGRPGTLYLDAAACKTDEPREVGLTKRLRSILMRALVYRDQVIRETGKITPWLFPRADGEQIRDYRKAWQTALRKAGFGKLEGRSGPWSSVFVPHDARRGAVRRLKRQGLDREARKAAIGHTTDEAHSLYEGRGHDPEALRATALQIDRARELEEGQENGAAQLLLFRPKG